MLVIAYNGTNYHGFAIQNDLLTIQKVLQDALSRILDEKIIVYASGRTDAYVHALNQVCHFHTKKQIACQNLMRGLNAILPSDIYVKKIKIVANDFHARFSAKNKTYIYRIYNSTIKQDRVFLNNFFLFYDYQINLSLLKKAAKLLVGSHDFSSFSIAANENGVRKINFIKFQFDDCILNITINANGFLRAMVRMIVGAFLDINEHKKNLQDIKNLLANPKKGSSITKAKACGLYLKRVYYE